MSTANTPNNPGTQNSAQTDLDFPEIQELISQIEKVALPAELKERLLRMTGRLKLAARVGGYSMEFESIKKYTDWAIKIPWNQYTQDQMELRVVAETLEKYHYGLKDVKDRVIEYLSVMKLNERRKQEEAQATTSDQMKKLRGSSESAPIMCFVGIQGVGKTSMAKSIANALGRQFVRISLGAMSSSTALRGRSRGEQDAEPGQIIKAIANTGVMNPLILLDEVDKVSSESGLRADVMAALLEILDPEQNATFVDHYIDFPVNLSRAIFITTANNLGGISTALLDRLEIIRFSSYSPEDKKIIGKNYLLPKVRRATGLTEEQLKFTDDVWELVVNPLGFDAGIRQLERNLTKIARKVARRIVDGIATSVTISPENFREFLPQDIEVYS